MMHGPSYREIPPAPALAGHVACYWTLDSGAGSCGDVHWVVPDGCIDIVVDLSDRGGPGTHVVGAMTQAIRQTLRETESWVGVRFRPGGAHSLLGDSLPAFTDLSVPLHEIDRDADALDEALARSPSAAARVAALEGWLCDRRAAGQPLDPLVGRAVAILGATAGAVTVSGLASALGVSRQHLTRRMKSRVGIGPKALSRILRVQAVARRLRCTPSPAGSTAALDSGYCDQAHMIHDFRQLTGRTPNQYARQVPFFQDEEGARS